MSLSREEFDQIVITNCQKSLSMVHVGSRKSVLNIVKNMDYDEPFLLEPTRLAVYPIVHQDLWNLYLKQRASHWVPEEINLSDDRINFTTLDEQTQTFVKNILAFFATADGSVIETICKSLLVDVNVMELQYIYHCQTDMECIHADMYGRLLLQIVQDDDERNRLTNSIGGISCISEKNSWARKWAFSSAPFAQRLIANAIVEGVFFSGSFCAIYWLKKKNKLPGLCMSNEFISRDENMHCETAYHVYKNKIVHKIPHETVYGMFEEAVIIEKNFINDSLKCDLIGMNSTLMAKYIEYVADVLLVNLGYDKLYRVDNPFDFMININMQTKSNFFEVRTTTYNKGIDNVGLSTKIDDDDENF